MRRALICLCGLALLFIGVGGAHAMPTTWSAPSTVGPRGDFTTELTIAASADSQVALVTW